MGYLIVWVIARFGAKPLAAGIGQFIGKVSLNSSVSAVTASQSSSFFLNGLAFSAILTVGYFIVRRVAYGINKVTWLPVIHQVNSLAGGLINLVIRYVVIFFDIEPIDFITQYQFSNQLPAVASGAMDR
ncbi:CvpA family protein [Levilactobacillus brevis]|uniref:CvpA family protein n=1 Tax=Levilactobacillus brevis TaxID=1580 RepID=UPI001CDA93EF|nr:CvpA family protein [Levilactobacillus brevis]